MFDALSFCKLDEQHLKIVNEIRNEYCEEFLHDSRKFTLEETKEWFNKYKPEYYIINYNNTPVGYFRISNINHYHKNLCMGADIHKDYCGIGIGYHAYKKFIPYLFEKYNLNKISLEVLSTNKKAFSLYKKLGFVVEGIKRQDVLKNNIWVDSIIMSLLRQDYENTKV